MIDRLIKFALRQRALVLLAAAGILLGGVYAARHLAIDAFPDVTNIQVQILTEAPGLSPIETEKLVTFPIEVQMSGLPGLTELRSLSKFGLSVVTVVFEDHVDTYFARQLVLERLIEAKDKLPEGIEPAMGPISTGLGEIYQYTIERVGPDGKTIPPDEQDLMERRTVQDWVVRPLLKTVPGVTDVNSFGGHVKQFQVLVDPDRLRKFDLTLREVFRAVGENNANAGGNFIEHASEQFVIRGVGLLRSIQDIEEIVVASHDGTPVYVRDVAQVVTGPEVRQGAIVADGRGEAVAGIVLMIRGGSGRDIVDRVKRKVADIAGVLPEGLTIVPFYDRTELVGRCIDTVTRALGEGAVLVLIVLVLFLGNLRSALIVVVALPLSALLTFIVMRLPQVNLSANLMSLGGLAIAIGMMVDGSVVMVENVFRHLAERSVGRPPGTGRLHAILLAATEVGRPITFGIFIIIAVFLPLFTLQGLEGKMFAPMAFTIAIALLGSLLLSLTLSPVLCSLFLDPRGGEKDTWIMRGAKRIYRPSLDWALRRRGLLLGIVIGSFLLSLALLPRLGTEFLPALDEGALAPQVIRLPSISLPASIEIEKEVQRTLLGFPEVVRVVSKIGRAEIASDPMGVNLSDPFVILRPQREWKTARTREGLVEAMREKLEEIPGVGYNISQPIALRVDELISGVKAQLAVKIFGDDLDALVRAGDQVASVLGTVPGARDVRAEQVAGQGYLTIDVDRRKIARYGINVADVQEVIETALGGKAATQFLEGDRRFDVVLRFPESRRNDPASVAAVLLDTPQGSRVPLGQLAEIRTVEGPGQISREDMKRRIVVECNVESRDFGGFVAEARRRVGKEVSLPAGYYVTWGGQFENQQRATARLAVVVPVVLGMIFFLLFSSFGSMKNAALIFLNVPFSLIGGILGLYVSGQNLSVSASVGFIALFGVAVLNGIVMVSYFNKLRQEGLALDDAIRRGAEMRLRPVLMTALVAALGIVPMLLSEGTGSEIQRPLATVVVGGLFSSTLLTLLLLPALYGWFERERVEF